MLGHFAMVFCALQCAFIAGIRVKGLINAAVDVTNMEEEKREKNSMVVAKHIQDGLQVQRDFKPGWFATFLFYGKHHGNYITILYVFVKVLFIINVIGQFFILNSFLGPQYTFWGVDILRDLLYGRPWEESGVQSLHISGFENQVFHVFLPIAGHFPRVTMCDFKVRVLGNLQNHSIQCVLMINMFNEKIYLFLWWWFLVVAMLTIVNMIYWFVVSVARNMQRDYVDHYLRVYSGMKHDDKDEGPVVTKRALSDFVDRELRPDGVLLLRLIAANAGDIVATSLVGALWRLFLEKKKSKVPPPPSVTGEKVPQAESDKNVVDPGFVESLPEEKVPLTGYQPLSG